jgi:hypothetical protein
MSDIVPQISRNLGNFHTILQDTLNIEPSEANNVQSILFLNHFYRRTQQTYSPLLPKLSNEIGHLKDEPVFGEYLIQLFECAQYLPLTDPETQLTLREKYFKSKQPHEQG